MSIGTMSNRAALLPDADFAADNVPSPKYMSFENDGAILDGDSEPSSPLPANGSASAASGDEKVAMRELLLTPENVITFFGRKNFLSNFASSPMTIAGHTYPSVEHYYEACKVYALAGPYYASYLKGVDDPGQAKMISKRILSRADKKDVNRWKLSDGILVVRVGLMEKYRQNPLLREQLFLTGNKVLVQCNQFDRIWASGMSERDFSKWVIENAGTVVKCPVLLEPITWKKFENIGKGRNLLGHLLMYCRECLRSEFGVVAPPEVKAPTGITESFSRSVNLENPDTEMHDAEEDEIKAAATTAGPPSAVKEKEQSLKSGHKKGKK